MSWLGFLRPSAASHAPNADATASAIPSDRRGIGRRAALLLPLLVAACSEERTDFPTLRYAYLPPIRLNVASITIEQHFIPSGVAPDVTQLDPAPPASALRAMAEDRLKAFGTSGRAVFIIQDASLTRRDDVIAGQVRVRLEIYDANNMQAAFVEARASARHTGRVGDLRERLYEMTQRMMDDMNVEFELQINRNLQAWLVSGVATPGQVQAAPLDGATAPPVNAAPLDGSGSAPPPGLPPGPPMPAATPGAPPPPTPLVPTSPPAPPSLVPLQPPPIR